jgi:DNA mismatch repair ATPase MutS
MINWKKDSSGKKIPEPVLGLDPHFDTCNDRVDELKSEFPKYVKKIQQKLGSTDGQIKLVASRKHRYEIQVHKSIDIEEYEDDSFTKTTSTAESTKYQSDKLIEMIEELQEAEEDLKAALLPFLRGMFKRFYDNR